MSKRSSSSSNNKKPSKRMRSFGSANSFDDANGSARLIAAHHAAERAGQGSSYLSTRPDPQAKRVRSLWECCVEVSARGLLDVVKVRRAVVEAEGERTGGGAAEGSRAKALFGWDPQKRKALAEAAAQAGVPDPKELKRLGDFIRILPSPTVDRVLGVLLRLSTREDLVGSDGNSQGIEVDIHRLSVLFLHPTTTRLSLSSLGPTSLLLSKIPQCTALAYLDLSSHTSLSDSTLKGVLGKLNLLEKVVLRGCTKVGDGSVMALAGASGKMLKLLNLNLTAVTIKGLTTLFVKCPNLEVLKLANIQGLIERNVSKLIDDATAASLSDPSSLPPLSRLQNLKLRSTDLTDSSLGRFLTLCAPTLTHLDVAYTHLKSLELLSRAVHSLPSGQWKLRKLVISGLPLTPASIQGFFNPLAFDRTEEERAKFHTLKMGALPAVSSKIPGLNDAVLEGIMPALERLEGLKSVSFYGNWELGKREQPMARFIEMASRRCTALDLTTGIQSYHLEGLLPSLEINGPPTLEILVLDSTKVNDEAAAAIAECSELRSLSLAETKISTKLLSTVLPACPRLTTLNLTSCRGVPVVQRRRFFEAWEKGEVEIE